MASNTSTDEPDYDVLIVGGGPAGMSAALQLGRSLRDVLICDNDEPRNRPSVESHGYLTRDGVAPDKFRRLGREEVTSYETVEFRSSTVTDSVKDDGRFVSTLESGETISSRKMVLATGVVDVFPDIIGFEQLWGSGVYHCPYCHGYEVRNQALGVHVDSSEKIHASKLIYNLSEDLIVFTDGHDVFDEETCTEFAERGIRIEDEPIAAFNESEGSLESIELENGQVIEREALFYAPEITQHSSLVEQFNLSLDEQNLVETDANGQTSIDGLFVVGDASNESGSALALAAAEGNKIGGVINGMLSAEMFEEGW